MGDKWAFTGVACGVIAVLIGIWLYISSHNHLLLKSLLIHFGIAYAISFTVLIIGGIYEKRPKTLGIVGFIFVFGGSLIVSSLSIQVWPGSPSPPPQLFTLNGLSWAFASLFSYSMFIYGYFRGFSKHILPPSVLILSMFPLVAGVVEVVKAGSPVVFTRHLTPLLLIYGLSMIASIPLYASGQSAERNCQTSTKRRRSKPVGIAAVCSIYVLSFSIGLTYYHPPMQTWTSVSFFAVTIIPALLVGYLTWKKSFDFSSNPST